MKGKVTPELLEQMKELRKTGATYKQIQEKCNVGHWTTIHYLKNIKIDQSVSELLWKKAETKAEDYLKANDFENILNLNNICPQCYFDYYATRENVRWLIDVTINENKDLVQKSIRGISGFRCAILYVSHDLKEYNMMELLPVKFKKIDK